MLQTGEQREIWDTMVIGQVCRDMMLDEQATWEMQANGVRVDSLRGLAWSIPTSDPPGRSKLTARKRISHPNRASFVRRTEPGGGGFRVARAVREAAGSDELSVLLLNEAEQAEGLEEAARVCGVSVLSVGRFAATSSLVLPADGVCRPNRLIVREPRRRRWLGLGRKAGSIIGRAAARAKVVAVVSASDWRLVRKVIRHAARAARVFCQPTGSLPRRAGLRLARRSTDLVLNCGELVAFARLARIPTPAALCETDERATELVVGILRGLCERRLAGTISCVVTMGARGCLVGDWVKGTITEVRFIARRGMCSTPVGTGDLFLGALLSLHARSEPAGRPPVAAALAASRFVAGNIGYGRDDFELRLNTVAELDPGGRSQPAVPAA